MGSDIPRRLCGDSCGLLQGRMVSFSGYGWWESGSYRRRAGGNTQRGNNMGIAQRYRSNVAPQRHKVNNRPLRYESIGLMAAFIPNTDDNEGVLFDELTGAFLYDELTGQKLTP